MSVDPSVWSILGVPRDATEREIRRAYAAKLKQTDMVQDPTGFEVLRSAYEIALSHRRYAILPTTPAVEHSVAEPAPTFANAPTIERSAAIDHSADPGELFATMRSLVAKPDYSVELWRKLLNEPLLDFPRINEAFEYQLVRALSEGELDAKFILSAGSEWRNLIERRYAWVSDGLRYARKFPNHSYLRDVLADMRRPPTATSTRIPGQLPVRLRRYWWILFLLYIVAQGLWKAAERGAT